MTASYRFALLAVSIAAALGLSACQPKTENVESTTVEEIEPLPTETSDTLETERVDDLNGLNDDGLDEDDVLSSDDIDTAELDPEDSEEELAAEIAQSEMIKAHTRAMGRMQDEMKIGMGYNDPDTAFAKSMLGHHRGAVDMAQIQLRYGTDLTLRKLAQDIIDTQQPKIDTIRRWLASHPDVARPKPDTQAMQQAYSEDIKAMYEEMATGLNSPIADLAFARTVLPLNIGAVDMALTQLKYGSDAEMRQLALQIINTQQPNIKTIQNWLAMQDNDTNANTNTDSTLTDETMENEAQTTAEPTT